MCLLAKFLKHLLKVIAGYKGKIILVRRKNSLISCLMILSLNFVLYLGALLHP